jgi:hypothetical protein
MSDSDAGKFLTALALIVLSFGIGQLVGKHSADRWYAAHWRDPNLTTPNSWEPAASPAGIGKPQALALDGLTIESPVESNVYTIIIGAGVECTAKGARDTDCHLQKNLRDICTPDGTYHNQCLLAQAHPLKLGKRKPHGITWEPGDYNVLTVIPAICSDITQCSFGGENGGRPCTEQEAKERQKQLCGVPTPQVPQP